MIKISEKRNQIQAQIDEHNNDIFILSNLIPQSSGDDLQCRKDHKERAELKVIELNEVMSLYDQYQADDILIDGHENGAIMVLSECDFELDQNNIEDQEICLPPLPLHKRLFNVFRDTKGDSVDEYMLMNEEAKNDNIIEMQQTIKDEIEQGGKDGNLISDIFRYDPIGELDNIIASLHPEKEDEDLGEGDYYRERY